MKVCDASSFFGHLDEKERKIFEEIKQDASFLFERIK